MYLFITNNECFHSLQIINNFLINTNNNMFTMHHVVKNEDCSDPFVQ